MLLKVLTLIRQVHQRSVLFVTICIFLDKGFKFQSSSCNSCHNVLIMSIDINDTVILNLLSVDFSCSFVGISKSEAIKY